VCLTSLRCEHPSSVWRPRGKASVSLVLPTYLARTCSGNRIALPETTSLVSCCLSPSCRQSRVRCYRAHRTEERGEALQEFYCRGSRSTSGIAEPTSM